MIHAHIHTSNKIKKAIAECACVKFQCCHRKFYHLIFNLSESLKWLKQNEPSIIVVLIYNIVYESGGGQIFTQISYIGYWRILNCFMLVAYIDIKSVKKFRMTSNWYIDVNLKWLWIAFLHNNKMFFSC